MFKENNNFEKFESKVWLSSPTMHGPEIEYVKEAYETNWMSTVGKNINEVERMACTGFPNQSSSISWWRKPVIETTD